jgi:HdeA/HdeB family protein
MSLRVLAVFAFVALLGAAPAPSSPQPAARIDITKVTCNDLLKSSPLDRAAVVMFYWGYAAAKAGASSFRTNVLQTATQHVMTLCAKNPSETMMQAMRDVDIKAF